MTSLALAMLLLTGAPGPGKPQPLPPTPRGLEVAPWADLEISQCKQRLETAGFDRGYEFSRRKKIDTRKRRRHDTLYCYVPQAAVWRAGPTGIKYFGFTKLSCAMTLAMTRFEKIVQEEAKRIFNTKRDDPVKAISHLGTYNCRRLRKKPDVQSQHSFGNAIDLEAFWIRGHGRVDVKKHWTARLPYLKKKETFLRAVTQRLKDEQVFTNVLDPEWDGFHKDHIHVDMAPLSDGLPSPALERVREMPTREAAATKPTEGGTPD